jgi:hypothetical protein
MGRLLDEHRGSGSIESLTLRVFLSSRGRIGWVGFEFARKGWARDGRGVGEGWSKEWVLSSRRRGAMYNHLHRK